MPPPALNVAAATDNPAVSRVRPSAVDRYLAGETLLPAAIAPTARPLT
jgi:hypothetical protein